ncbi:MAG TPA: TonB-dependent receptor, partial [Opitutaceae bacterium]|nr:TonB-dependent receptor [Opitutaceae bacterium]
MHSSQSNVRKFKLPFGLCAAVCLLLSGYKSGAQTASVAPDKKSADEVVSLEKFSVQDRITDPAVAIGTDSTRNNINISREALLAAPAGISGLKMLETLPGFNVQTSDALGFYEFGNSVFVRAFKLDQIGFMIDGIPLGRNAAFGGSPIYRMIDNENLGRISAAEGSGDVTFPSYSSLGPAVTYTTLAPSSTPAITAAYTAGDNSLQRIFLRVQSGEYHGVSAYISRSKITGNLWNSPGTINREHWEGKVRYRISADHELTFNFVTNQFHDYDSPSITKSQYFGTAGDFFGRSGRRFGYLGYVPDLPPTATGIPFSNSLYNQYYQQAINDRHDKLFGLNGSFKVMPDLVINTTAYLENKRGYGVSPESYATSLSNYNAEVNAGLTGLTAPRGLQYGLSTLDGDRYGFIGKGVLQYSINKIESGFWVERDNYHRTQNRYNQAGGNPAGQPLLNELVHLQRDYRSRTDTAQVFAKDTVSLLGDKLKLEAGVKTLDIGYQLQGARVNLDYRAGIRPRIDDSWNNNFLPQVGAVYNLTPEEQIFASYSENMARPVADDVYSAASLAATQKVKAEQSRNFELGARTNRGSYNAALAVYATSFRNRLQQFSSLVPGSTQTESFYQNVGAVQAYGAELSGGWRPEFLKGIAFNGGGSYNQVKFQNNYVTYSGTTPILNTIKDNTVPDSPKWMMNGGVTYEPYRWIAMNVSARFTGMRYSNFTNTESVPSYTVFDTYLDLGGDKLSWGPLKSVKFRLNVTNLFDKDYLGAITTVASGAAVYRPGPNRTFSGTVTAS